MDPQAKLDGEGERVTSSRLEPLPVGVSFPSCPLITFDCMKRSARKMKCVEGSGASHLGQALNFPSRQLIFAVEWVVDCVTEESGNAPSCELYLIDEMFIMQLKTPR